MSDDTEVMDRPNTVTQEDEDESTYNNVPVVVDYEAARNVQSATGKALAADAESRLALKGGLKTLASGRSDEFAINPFILKTVPGWNSRNMALKENQEHVDELARSIAEIGVKETLTIVVEDGVPYVTNGHCRLLAVFRAIEVYGADIKTVPVKTEGRAANEGDQILSQIVRNAGKSLSTIERSVVYKKLLDFGWTVTEIARKVGKTKAHVTQTLDLYAAPQRIKRMVIEGKVSSTTAMAMVKKHGDGEAEILLNKAIKHASSEGKEKATGKDIESVSPSKPTSTFTALKKIMKAVLPTAKTDQGYVFLKLDAIQHQNLKALLNV